MATDRDVHPDSDERRPLLDRSHGSTTRLPTLPETPKVHDPRAIVAILCAVILVISSSGGMLSIPLTSLLESAICRDYSAHARETGADIDFKDICKSEPVQSRVAYYFAINTGLEALFSFVGALPWGIVADKIGRKKVFLIALVGVTVDFLWWMFVIYFNAVMPVWTGLLAPIALFIGGGNAVLVSVLYSTIADLISEDKRAVAMMQTHVASMVGNLMSPALASVIMNVAGPWPVMWLCVICCPIGALAYIFVPDTVPSKSSDNASPEDYSSDSGFKARMMQTLAAFKQSILLLNSASLITLMVVCFMTAPIVTATFQFLVQFTSKRYGIPIKDTGYVQAGYGAVNVFMAFVGLPLISRMLTVHSENASTAKRNDSKRDLTLARFSYFVLVPGLAVLGFAPTLAFYMAGLVILAVGSGYGSYAKSLMVLFVDSRHRSQLFSLAAMVDVGGQIYASGLLAALFSKGMKLDGVWMGLPYFVLTLTTALACVLLLFVRLPRKLEGDVPLDEEES